MFKEIQTTAENFQPGDRVHLFWANLPDGNLINGGSNILNVNKEVPEPSKEWLEQEGWGEGKIKHFENLRKSNKLILVELQTDYYSPSTVVFDKDMPVSIIREETLNV